MQAPPEFGFQQLVSELLRGVAGAVADRPGQTEAQRFARHQTAIFSVMALLPRDAMEAMLAGQCVMIDHLLRDAVSDLLRSETAAGKLRIRTQVTALGRQFLKHLEQFCRMRARPDQQPAAPTHVERAQVGLAQVERVHVEPELSPAAPPAPEPTRQTTTAAPLTPDDAPATVAAQPLLPQDAPPAGKSVQLQQRGFQNRRMRRALRFKPPAGKAKAPAIQPAPRSGLS